MSRFKSIQKMRILLALILLPCAIFAQTLGDNREKVISLLGNPPLSRVTGNKEIWLYTTNGTRITFENGLVTEVSQSSDGTAPGGDATAATPASSAGAKHSSNTIKIILVTAVLIGMVCHFLIIIAAFSDGAGWGLAVMFVPFVSLIYILTHFGKVKIPVLILLFVAVPLLALGAYLGHP
jgi:hypothetical protein